MDEHKWLEEILNPTPGLPRTGCGGGGGTAWTEEEMDACIGLWEAGFTAVEVNCLTGIGMATIYLQRRKRGITGNAKRTSSTPSPGVLVVEEILKKHGFELEDLPFNYQTPSLRERTVVRLREKNPGITNSELRNLVADELEISPYQMNEDALGTTYRIGKARIEHQKKWERENPEEDEEEG